MKPKVTGEMVRKIVLTPQQQDALLDLFHVQGLFSWTEWITPEQLDTGSWLLLASLVAIKLVTCRKRDDRLCYRLTEKGRKFAAKI